MLLQPTVGASEDRGVQLARAGSNRHLNRLCVFSRVVGSNLFKGRATARFSCESKDYKPFKESRQYKPTDVAVKPETVTPEDTSSRPGRIDLLSVRCSLVQGSVSA